MNKQEYINSLLFYMEERGFDEQTIEEVTEDYSLMIDEAFDNGIDEGDLESFLGRPSEIIKNINRSVVIKRIKKNKFVALSPFIAMIIFFGLGFGFSLWNYAWVAFLLVPLSGILSTRKRHGSLSVLTDILPLITLGVFIGIGINYDVWHPTWVVFLLIPAVSLLNSKTPLKFLYLGFFIGIIITYLLSYFYFPFKYNWVLLILLLMPVFKTTMFTFRINGVRVRSLEISMFFIVVFLLLTYFILGAAFNIWHPLWLIFLLIPVSAIYLSNIKLRGKQPVVAYMPFIALSLFILVGEYFNGYQWSWLFFLLIPMVAIIKN